MHGKDKQNVGVTIHMGGRLLYETNRQFFYNAKQKNIKGIQNSFYCCSCGRIDCTPLYVHE